MFVLFHTSGGSLVFGPGCSFVVVDRFYIVLLSTFSRVTALQSHVILNDE